MSRPGTLAFKLEWAERNAADWQRLARERDSEILKLREQVEKLEEMDAQTALRDANENADALRESLKEVLEDVSEVFRELSHGVHPLDYTRPLDLLANIVERIK